MSRYVVRELEGWEIRPLGGEQGPRPGLSVHVLDTALNYRIVATYRSERVPGALRLTRAARRAMIRARAEGCAEFLNHEHALAIARNAV